MNDFIEHIKLNITDVKEAGLYKAERVISSAQSATVNVVSDDTVLNFCANNYLGLADHPELMMASVDALDKYGFGLSSVRPWKPA